MNQTLRDKLRAMMGPGWQEATAPGSLYGSVIKEPDYDAPDTIGAGTPVGVDRRGAPITAGDAQAIRHGYEFSGLGGLLDRRQPGEPKATTATDPLEFPFVRNLKDRLQIMGEIAGGALQMRGGIGKPGIPKKSTPSMFEMLGDKEVPRLSREEANQLAIRAKTDPKAMEELMERLQPFVATVVQKHARKGGVERFDMDLMNDLMQEFNRRIPRMVERFDPTRARVRQSPTGETTPVPADFLSYVANPKNELMLLQYKRSAQSPVGMSGPAAEKRLQKVDELDAPVPTKDDDTLSMHEVLEDVRQSSLRASGDMKVDAMNTFKKMRERDRQLLEMRLGIGEEEPLAEATIAARLGISQQAVHKALQVAEQNFRRALEETEIGKQAVERMKRGGTKAAKPIGPKRPEPPKFGDRPIGGGSDVDPELQAYNREWEQAYQNFLNAERGSNKSVFGESGKETARSYLEDMQNKDYINLPPRRGAPLSPHQEAIVDQLGVGRLRMPPVEPDPEIVRQLRAPQNVTSHLVPTETDEVAYHNLRARDKLKFLESLDPRSRALMERDDRSIVDVYGGPYGWSQYQNTEDWTGLPLLSTGSGMRTPIFGMKSVAYPPDDVDWRAFRQRLNELEERGLWP